MKQLLSDCHKYYIDGGLKSDCENMKCVAPLKCTEFNAVYNILHFLADNAFNVSMNEHLSLKYMQTINVLYFRKQII